MSEMNRPAPPPAALDHDQHDPLLMAQLVADDPLDPARGQEAQGWLATCPACARLATDLRWVSAAVANEPVPPRRRDFRIGPEQAERLRGNALTRFLRGLSPPRGRAFAPVAAGLMSVGLVFVVAGYVWPESGSVSLSTDTNVAPAMERPADSPVPLLEVTPGGDALITQAAPEAPVDALDFFASDPEALEGLAEHQAGSSVGSESMQKSLEAETSEELLDEAARSVMDGLGVSASTPPRAVAGAPDGVAEPAEAAEAAEPADDGRVEALVEASASAADQTAGVPGEEAGAVSLEDDAAATELAVASADDDGLERWLLLVGLALASVGALLLLLGWLSRRSADPLLR